ncbi:unnamed protein product [Knipowitschia caucasica]|uniref:G-protein coupled receptors family 1 profile domain-containing protein n=1 Tax=Knipowitschia caucasica TaxID=637954 RepID=A0AAV2IU48_KNICA
MPLRTLLVLLAFTHASLSLWSDGETQGKTGDKTGAHLARTFHWTSRESHPNTKSREHHATGAGAAGGGKASHNFTHPGGRVVKEARKTARNSGNNNLNRTVTSAQDAHWDLTRQQRNNNKRIKLNGGLSAPAAGGHYNAPKPSSVRVEEVGGDGRKSVSKEDGHKKAASKRGKTHRNKSEKIIQAQALSAFWEPMPKPVALTSTDLPFDMYTRRTDYFYTFRGEENPWDATPMTPPSSLDFVDEIKNPFWPVTSETFGAYAITCVSGVIFLVGIAGNIAILCIVCQNYYMKSISNSLLANLAVWDFVLILFCLPMVVFHELTKSWLLGEFTCKVVPYLEVMLMLILSFLCLCTVSLQSF